MLRVRSGVGTSKEAFTRSDAEAAVARCVVEATIARSDVCADRETVATSDVADVTGFVRGAA